VVFALSATRAARAICAALAPVRAAMRLGESFLRWSPAIATPTASLPARAARSKVGTRLSTDRSQSWPKAIARAVAVATRTAKRSGRTGGCSQRHRTTS
jgi:hypothetical protein